MKILNSKFALVACILTFIFSAWAWLFYQHLEMTRLPMTQMWMPPNQLSSWKWIDFYLLFSMWSIMMAAMMLPSALPMITSFHSLCQRQKQTGIKFSLLFAVAYLLIWAFFSVFLSLLQMLFHIQGWLSPMMETENHFLTSGLFLLASAYQFSTLKQSCLSHCQSPVGFLMNHWQPGYKGAIAIGLKHGMTCLGCCWAQMLLMFAVGVMNIVAMAVITLLICIEKFLPVPAKTLSQITAVVLIVWAVIIF